jgi:hypothetical protein
MYWRNFESFANNLLALKYLAELLFPFGTLSQQLNFFGSILPEL